MEHLAEEIKKLAKQQQAVILAHNYQIEEVQLIADYLGDSLELSRIAAKIKQPVIVFAGVKFMAETAKILSPQKTILLPRLDAGCPMADMITVEELQELKKLHPDAAVVTYVNSSVEIKAESDVCCTSANAVNVVKNIRSKKIIFIPDQNLGSYVQQMVPEKEMFFFEGYCYVHNRIKAEDILEIKQNYPQAVVIAHPEVKKEVRDLADGIYSTSGMLKFVSQSPHNQFIVATEQGLLERMKRENPKKEFFPPLRPRICVNMKRTSLLDVYLALQKNQYQVEVAEDIAKKASAAINKMLDYI
jgi:quinolinate synthase